MAQHGASGARALDAPQDRPDAAAQLRDPDRLGHVVVGARLEREDDVGLAVARGEGDHVGASPAARRRRQTSTPSGPGAEADVEQHEVEVWGQRVERGAALGGLDDGVAVRAEGTRHDVAQVGLVLDDEDAATRARAGVAGHPAAT